MQHALPSPCHKLAGWLASCAALCGCQAAFPSYSTTTTWEQKDVLVVTVFLPEKLASADYVSISTEELERIRRRIEPTEVPLYEVRFDFYTEAVSSLFQRRLAQVSLFPTPRLASADHAPRVVLY